MKGLLGAIAALAYVEAQGHYRETTTDDYPLVHDPMH